MPAFAFLRKLGFALVKGALNPAGIVDVVEAMNDAYTEWAKEKNEQQRIAEFQLLVAATLGELRQQVAEALTEVRQALKPQEAARFDQDRGKLENILLQVPANAQRVWRRRSDPTGTTPPGGTRLAAPEDIAALIPDRVARFQPGEQPVPGYQLDQLLGHGGFSEVWLAHVVTAPAKKVAIKFPSAVIPVGLRADDNLLAHEIAIVNSLMSKRVTQGILQFEQANPEATPPYIIYPFIDGGDLTGLIRDWYSADIKTLSASQQQAMATKAHQLILRLAEIMAPVHRAGIVHRDLKPSNVLVKSKGIDDYELFIADFGIGLKAAAAKLSTTRGMTSQLPLRASRIRGSCTPTYASPEQQFDTAPADPRDDMHAIGVIWYQLLVGDVTRGVPNDWHRRLNKDIIGADFLDLFAECMSSERAERIADAGTLVEKLKGCFRSRDVQWQQKQEQERRDKEQADWSTTSGSRSVASYKRFLEKWPNGTFANQAKAEISRLNSDAERSHQITMRYIAFGVGGPVVGAVMLGGVTGLIGAVGWATIVLPIIGLLLGAVAGLILGALLGAFFSSYGSGHTDCCCQFHWGEVNEEAVKGFAIIGAVIGAIGGIIKAINIVMQGSHKAHLWEWSAGEGALWGGLVGAVVGLIVGLILAAQKNDN